MLNRNPKGKKPQYFSDPATDKLLDMVVKLTAELSVTRDRLDALERVLENHDIGFSREDLEKFSEDAKSGAERHEKRRQLIAQVLQVLDDEVAEVTKPDPVTSIDDLVMELGED
jgi:predicted  nucleic acid-binding Zn-ribbon protein